jgi:hypothetical protein
MTKLFFAGPFAVGLAVLGWIAAGFVGASWVALAITAVIAAVYLLGAWELRQFRAATRGLAQALRQLAQTPARLADWLPSVPSGLRDAVRLRIAGERAALPGPALTPYLVGLLVMLGMLGTFLGMVMTFKGAVFALEGSTDLQAIRGALAAPIRGLGLSFGTSVAGVASSAMLGLMAALARRERLQVARELDARIAGVLQPFSLVHQRQETFQALQAQARSLPQVTDALSALVDRIERRSEQLDATLLERQAQFQREATLAYTTLADRVGASLRESLASSAQAASDAIRPVVADAMSQVVQEAHRTQERLAGVAQQQVDALSQQFQNTLGTTSDALSALRDAEEQRGEAAVARLAELQGAVAQHLAQLGSALEAPLTRLLHTASEVPQAAAGVITDLRQEMSRLTERDNAALQERNELLGELRALVASAAATMEQAATQFATVVETHAGRTGEAAAHVAAGAIEVASVAEAFQQAVTQFQAGNDKLVASLEKIDASLTRSTARSDEQLAYYVEQAREVIDLSIASQQGVIEQLRHLQDRGTPVAEEARA